VWKIKEKVQIRLHRKEKYEEEKIILRGCFFCPQHRIEAKPSKLKPVKESIEVVIVMLQQLESIL
jgi:hypothetical protein